MFVVNNEEFFEDYIKRNILCNVDPGFYDQFVFTKKDVRDCAISYLSYLTNSGTHESNLFKDALYDIFSDSISGNDTSVVLDYIDLKNDFLLEIQFKLDSVIDNVIHEARLEQKELDIMQKVGF